jgi:hypothetical protein
MVVMTGYLSIAAGSAALATAAMLIQALGIGLDKLGDFIVKVHGDRRADKEMDHQHRLAWYDRFVTEDLDQAYPVLVDVDPAQRPSEQPVPLAGGNVASLEAGPLVPADQRQQRRLLAGGS